MRKVDVEGWAVAMLDLHPKRGNHHALFERQPHMTAPRARTQHGSQRPETALIFLDQPMPRSARAVPNKPYFVRVEQRDGERQVVGIETGSLQVQTECIVDQSLTIG